MPLDKAGHRTAAPTTYQDADTSVQTGVSALDLPLDYLTPPLELSLAHLDPVQPLLSVAAVSPWFGSLTQGFLCSLSWPGTQYVDQAALKFAAVLLPLWKWFFS